MSLEFTLRQEEDDGWATLKRLIQAAVETRSIGTLVSIQSASKALRSRVNDTQLVSAGPLPGDLNGQIENVQQALRQGPVLYRPEFGRMKPSAPRGSAHLHEHLVLSIEVPCGPAILAVVLPANVLSSARPMFRAELASKWNVELIVETSTSRTTGMSGLQLAVLLLTAPDHDGATRFFRYKPNEDPSELEGELRELMKQRGGQSKHGFVHRSPLGSENWSYDYHDPKLASETAGLSAFGTVTTIGDLYTVLSQGTAPTANARVIHGRDLQSDGSIAPPESGTNSSGTRVQSGPLLQSNDIIISAVTPKTGLRIARVTTADLPARAGHTLLVLREKDQLTPVDQQFIVTYLRSSAAVRQLRATGAGRLAGHLRITGTALKRLPVPVLDDELRKAFADLDDGQRQMNEWARESQAVLSKMFDSASPESARLSIMEGGRLLRQRVEAGHLLEDLGYQVRNTFPYPVAYRWRTVEAMGSRGDVNGTIESVLGCFEVLLCYLSQAVLALGHATSDQVNTLHQVRKKVDSGRSGPSLGDWIQLLDEVATSKRFRSYERPHLFAEVREFHGDAVRRAIRLLAERRNDESHLRVGTTESNRRAVDHLVNALRTLLKEARFLADMPLLHVTGIEWDSLRRRGTVEHRVLAGDHPVVPYAYLETEQRDLEKGSLYIADPAGRLHLLRPFLIGRECDECHTWSTFHLDRISGAAVKLKSLEHGHVLTVGDLREAYEAVDHLSGS